MDDDELQESELTAEEILTFGPCVEAQVWTPVWVQESRAPIAVAAGRPKLGRVFDDSGVGKMVTIRPCASRGRRIRGLPPVYTSRMLERNAGVFNGWPMFMDHIPPELAETLAKRGRSVKELGGQVLTGHWKGDYVHEDDRQYGYQKGGVVADIWATPFIRKLVSENANLLHTSINAWPTSGKPGPVPWNPKVKGMLIEGIRRQPQGSVDYVVRGGAGGRLLVAEGLEEDGEWPELGEWSEEDRAFVVSVAESFYASPRMSDLVLPSKPDELQEWIQEHAPHLAPAFEAASSDDDADDVPASKKKKGKNIVTDAGSTSGLTEEDVRRLIEESESGTPTVEEFETHLRESFEATLQERETQRGLAEHACELIESAEGIPHTWKADLKARYAMLPSGPPATLLVEGEHKDDDGNALSERQVVEERVKEDLQHVRDLIAEAQGKPRVTGEGGAKPDPAGDNGRRRAPETRFWRERFVGMGLAESADKAVEALGGKVEG